MLMYLSRLMLNPRSRQVQREILDPYQMHRTIMRAFPGKRDRSGVLHRLDLHPRTGAITLLVQSLAEPDWTWLTEKDYLQPFPGGRGVANPAVKRYDPHFQAGQVLRFRLRANPTIKKVRREESGKHRNSNRVPLVRPEQQMEWLNKRAQANGFRLLRVEISQPQELSGHKEDANDLIKVYAIRFDGQLQVTDPARLHHAVTAGIGPAKAFGCGLLSLAPA